MELYQQAGFLLFGTRLRRLSELFLSDVKKVYRRQRIRFEPAWFPVFYLLSRDGQVTIRSIADALCISHPAASQLVSTLQQKKLVQVGVSVTDARQRVVRLTPRGQQLLQQVLPVWHAMQAAMEELCNERPETRNLRKALSRLEESMARETVFERMQKHLQ
ncbi:MAG: MarR family winged helix-turn-helix transcriptional regulator [Lacibacter sp.]